MKKLVLSFGLCLITTCLLAADSNPKEELAAATNKLGEQPSYSWKQTVIVPESAPFKPGPTEGKLVKDGVTYFTVSFGDNTTKIYLKDGKAAVSNPESGWRSAKELENDEGPGRFIGFIIRAFRAPAVQAKELADAAKELKKDGEVFFSDMTDEGAKAQFRFGNVTNPKGSVKFWIKDGQLAKYQVKLTGKADFGGNEVDVDRDTTIELTDINATKIEVPTEAKKILEPAPAPATTNAPAKN